MTRARLLRALLVLVAAAAAACGDDTGDGANPDAPPTPDGMDPDAPPAETFTKFVIDLVEGATADDTEPRAFAEFSTLADPDLDNPDAYDPLFP